MGLIVSQVTVKMPRLMEVGEYRKLRYAGAKPSLQLLKKWIAEGVLVGEVRGGMYFVDLYAALLESHDPLLAKMLSLD